VSPAITGKQTVSPIHVLCYRNDHRSFLTLSAIYQPLRVTTRCERKPTNTKLAFTHRLFATRVSLLKIWAFLSYWYKKETFADALLTGIVSIKQFAQLAAGEQLCRRCTHTKSQQFKTFKGLS